MDDNENLVLYNQLSCQCEKHHFSCEKHNKDYYNNRHCLTMTGAIANAVGNARYNELVEVETEDEKLADGSTRQIVLAATLDRTNGGLRWDEVCS
ncbi:MAG: hypothetical protein AAGM67_06670, partial [Bacteroidota bacterium]